jgi:hypothetical protein
MQQFVALQQQQLACPTINQDSLVKTTHRFVGSLLLGCLILSCAGGDRILGPPSPPSTNADSTGRTSSGWSERDHRDRELH